MGILPFFGCCALVLGVSVFVLIGSVLVRAAVALANRVLGPATPADTFGQWDDWDSDEPVPKARKGKGRVIPEPGLTTGMLVAFVAVVVDAIAYAALAFLAEEALGMDGPDELPVVLLFLVVWVPFTALALAGLLVLLLPTTFPRAVLVAFLHHLIVAAIVVAVGAVGAFLWAATGP